MTDTKVSDLPAVVTPAGTDEFPVAQSGASKKMTLAQIKTYATVAPTTGSVHLLALVGTPEAP